jgi:hypothetical protein
LQTLKAAYASLSSAKCAASPWYTAPDTWGVGAKRRPKEGQVGASRLERGHAPRKQP